MEKVTIKRVIIKDHDKNGSPYRDKNGKPFKRVGIQTDKHGDQWLLNIAYNDYDPKLKLQEGQQTEIEVEQNGDFTNFKIPTRLDLLERRVEALEKPKENTADTVNTDGFDDIPTEEIPFN